jgi:transcriptional regulator with XRE-family HTH domain
MITLRDARNYHGYSLLYVSKKCGASEKIIENFETDSSEINIGLLKRLIDIYKFPLSSIFIGSTFDYIQSTEKYYPQILVSI